MHQSKRFRILQVASGMRSLSGGTEKHVLDISTALARRGHSVTLACPRYCSFSRRVEELGLPRVPFDVRSAHDWKQLSILILLCAGNYDIVHTHLPLDYVATAIAARVRRTPAVVMTRHMTNPFASSRNAYICSSLLYDRIIAVSTFVRTVLVESGARLERIDVVHNGIVPMNPDPRAAFRLREELRIPQNATLIAAAGRISSGKGFEILLKAVRQLSINGLTVYCVIFGTGKLHEQMRTLATELQIDSKVRLPGFRSDVHDLWCAADVAVIPSVEPESFSYTAIEALSAGCAVVASAVGALPEVLSAESAILIQPGDVEGLANAMRALISAPELRNKMQQAAQQRAKLFTLDASVAGLERVYESLLGCHRQGSILPGRGCDLTETVR